MELKSLMVDSKSVWVDYPEFDGFEVEVASLSNQEFRNIRKNCVKEKFDRNTRQKVEVLNEDKFVKEFTRATLKNWKGLKFKYLERMMLVDISDQDPEGELDFSIDNAIVLVSNSSDFDTWLNEVIFDLDNFRSVRDSGDVEETGEVAE